MEADNSQHIATYERAGLSRKQEQAVAALMANPTLEAAAGAMKVNPVTLTRWLRVPAFQDAYRDARREAVTHAVATIQAATSEAVETLRAIMRDGNAPAGSRVAAARTILDTALKAVELEDLAARVEALEAAAPLAGSGNGRWN
jgi:hypothetical protein